MSKLSFLKEYINLLTKQILFEGKDFMEVQYPKDIDIDPKENGFHISKILIKKLGVDLGNGGTVKFSITFVGEYGNTNSNSQYSVKQKFPYDEWTIWFDLRTNKIDNTEKNDFYHGTNRRELSPYELKIIKNCILQMMKEE